MFARLPPRREPRVLALARSPTGFHYATADPWELRAVGSVTCRALSLGPAIAKAVRREKPTLVVTRDREIEGPLRRVARRFEIPVADGSLPTLPRPIAEDLYPDLPMRAPSHALQRTAALAISAVLYAEAPSRTYATRRNRPSEHPARAARPR